MVATQLQPLESPAPMRISRRQYDAMIENAILTEQDRVELINGFIIPKMPTGNSHAAIVKRLNFYLSQLVRGRALVSVQDPIAIHDYSKPEPDVALLKLRPDFYAKATPQPHEVLLIIEVADSSLAYDRAAKIPLYAAADIAEAWLVDVNGRSITVFTQPDGAAYQRSATYREGDEIPLTAFPGETFSASQLGL